MASEKIQLKTNHGIIELALNPEKAPKTVANFKKYVEEGHFDHTLFHRTIPGFMIQGGGFNEDMSQKSTHGHIENEADNGLKNIVGSVAMARTNDPHSATAQFFINVANNEFLNHRSKSGDGWGYAVFGEVTSGMDVVQKIAKVATTRRDGHQDVPKEPVIIESATIITAE
jgi:peptidyl-prolyl cis-trans isomerase B (cyclophilin B)